MKCPNCGKELKDSAKFCGGCGTKIEASASKNVSSAGGTVCPNCGKQLKPGAKFCGGCGTKLGDAPRKNSQSTSSSSRGNAAEKGFFQNMMNHFRKRDSNNSSNSNNQPPKPPKIDREDIDVSGSCLHWNVLPGQLAVKIDYKTLDGCGKVKGIIIQDGTKALVFANGAFVGEMPGGRYIFKNIAPVTEKEDRKTGFKRIVSGIKEFFKGEQQKKKLESFEDVTFVIVRDSTFPLLFEYNNVVTGPVTSSRVALHALAKITDVNIFYKELLLDKQFVSFEFIAQSLNELCHTSIEQILRDKAPNQINTPDSIDAIRDELSSRIATVFPFITVQAVVRVTAENAELEELRAMREELYISEEKLTELQRRNDYLNRLTDENNSQILREAHTQADFTAAMNKIDEQNLLTDDEKERFAMTLHAQRVIREAQSNDEVVAALADLQKAGLLRDEEIDTLVHQIAQRTEIRNLTDADEVDTLRREIDQNARMQEITDVQAINLATLQNDRIIDEQKLAWEIEVGNKRIENQLERQRLMDEYNDARRKYEDDYSDTRRDKDAAFQDSRRRAEMDMDKEEQQNQLEMLRQAQAIRQEREDAEHRRAMEDKQVDNEQELKLKEAERLAHKDELDADLEKNKIYAGMSAEQIMAANPNISESAAAALAAKFSSENAVEAQKQINEAQKQSNEQMMGMMQQFMSQMQADKAADREQQLQYMQMMANQNNVQMQQMGAMASNIAMGKSADAEARMKEKEEAVERQQKAMDAEIARADKASEKLQDRMLDAMQTSVKAISSIKTPNVTVQGGNTNGSNGRKDAPAVCPNCGAEVEAGSSFCGECGTAI